MADIAMRNEEEIENELLGGHPLYSNSPIWDSLHPY